MRGLLSLSLLCLGTAMATPLHRETIVDGLHDPMSLAVAPDGDLYVIEREGRLLRVRPSTGGVFEIGQISVSALRASDPKSDSAVEDGLQGIALDPEFAKNQRVFLFYSHPEHLLERLSRFELRHGKLDPSSERVLLEIPAERHDRVCHHGGSLAFDPDGLLLLSVGDNTNPFASDGSAPIDPRADRSAWDAARSAGNTNDLRGKILRIRPTENGYEIPNGNLFPPGTAKTRPEIYVMGCRNPFRISIDPKKKTLYWGEVGPDAAAASEKGPAGHDEINQAKSAGNFGWPFVIADNQAYAVHDFAGGQVGPMTDPAAPRNPSPRNTGLPVLPAAQPAFIWYPYAASSKFPSMDKGGRNAMAGPVFYHDPQRPHNILSPQEDHSLLTYDWIRGKIWKAKLGSQEELVSLDVMESGFTHPMDLEMANDGTLWLLDYGSDWWFNKNGKIIRLLPANTRPSPEISISQVAGQARSFTAHSTAAPESITWWLTTGSTEERLGSGSSITLAAHSGTELRAVAADGKGPNAVARLSLVASQAVPELTLKITGDPSALEFSQSIDFDVSAGSSPTPPDLVVRARHIPATGHDAGGPQFPQDINALVVANQCLACHQIDHSSVGPRYLDVALKYRDQADAKEKLIAKLKSGGAGVWGEIPMPPQSALKPEDAQALISAILDLATGISENRSGRSGTLKLAPPPATVQAGGAWEITAEAKGFTPAKLRIPVGKSTD
jgi:cytochrome c